MDCGCSFAELKLIRGICGLRGSGHPFIGAIWRPATIRPDLFLQSQDITTPQGMGPQTSSGAWQTPIKILLILGIHVLILNQTVALWLLHT